MPKRKNLRAKANLFIQRKAARKLGFRVKESFLKIHLSG
jgi:hypothetical protein